MPQTETTAVSISRAHYLPEVSPAAIEQALAIGDMSKMSNETRVAYYVATCQSAGLNPYTRPFDLIKGDDGTVRLYPNKVAAEQLRKLHRVSMRILERRTDTENGLYIVTVRASTPDGREDEAQGIVDIVGKKGAALANFFMRAETKAKRRATLSLCGLGYDDSEDVTGHPVRFDYQQGHIETPARGAIPATTPPRSLLETAADLYGEPREIPNFATHTPMEAKKPPTPTSDTSQNENVSNRQVPAANRHIDDMAQDRPSRRPALDHHPVAPAQTELHGVEADDIPPQVYGGETYIDQINAVLRANGESEEGIETYWRSTCRRCKASSPVAIKMAWLPRLLEERRTYYRQREQAQQEDMRRADPLARLAPVVAPGAWRSALADAALAVPENAEALHEEIAAALMSTDMPDEVAQALMQRVAAWVDTAAAAEEV